jgi:hypothetical protein
MEQCYFLWTYQLPGGTCADWFSGTVSALAVVTALLGYAFNEWRQQKRNKRQEEEDAAAINFLLRRALNEAHTIHELLASGYQQFRLGDVDFEIDNTMKGISFETIDVLDKSQLRFLASYGCMNLITKIADAVVTINQTNRNLFDYAIMVERFYECLRRDDAGNKTGLINISDIDLKFDTMNAAKMCNQSRAVLKQEAARCLAFAIDAAKEFNDFIDRKFSSRIDFKIHFPASQAVE